MEHERDEIVLGEFAPFAGLVDHDAQLAHRRPPRMKKKCRGNTPGGLEPSLLLRESKPSLLVLCDDVNPFSGFKGGGDGHGWANDGFWSGVKR